MEPERMASIGAGGGAKATHSKQSQYLSPEAQTIQHLLMRYAMDWLGQGRQDFASFLQGGGHPQPYPATPISQAETRTFGVHPGGQQRELSIFDFLRA